jgi:hypothetical protein
MRRGRQDHQHSGNPGEAPSRGRIARDADRQPTRTSWEAYTGDGRCDTCRQPATQAFVRLHALGTLATSLLRLACAAHRR